MSYQGHPSRRLWNLSLWMANDEPLYNAARHAIGVTGTKDRAAAMLFDFLEGTETPDGYRWTLSGIRYALRGI